MSESDPMNRRLCFPLCVCSTILMLGVVMFATAVLLLTLACLSRPLNMELVIVGMIVLACALAVLVVGLYIKVFVIDKMPDRTHGSVNGGDYQSQDISYQTSIPTYLCKCCRTGPSPAESLEEVLEARESEGGYTNDYFIDYPERNRPGPRVWTTLQERGRVSSGDIERTSNRRVYSNLPRLPVSQNGAGTPSGASQNQPQAQLQSTPLVAPPVGENELTGRLTTSSSHMTSTLLSSFDGNLVGRQGIGNISNLQSTNLTVQDLEQLSLIHRNAVIPRTRRNLDAINSRPQQNVQQISTEGTSQSRDIGSNQQRFRTSASGSDSRYTIFAPILETSSCDTSRSPSTPMGSTWGLSNTGSERDILSQRIPSQTSLTEYSLERTAALTDASLGSEGPAFSNPIAASTPQNHGHQGQSNLGVSPDVTSYFVPRHHPFDQSESEDEQRQDSGLANSPTFYTLPPRYVDLPPCYSDQWVPSLDNDAWLETANQELPPTYEEALTMI